jgi:hypothetical protein
MTWEPEVRLAGPGVRRRIIAAASALAMRSAY